MGLCRRKVSFRAPRYRVDSSRHDEGNRCDSSRQAEPSRVRDLRFHLRSILKRSSAVSENYLI